MDAPIQEKARYKFFEIGLCASRTQVLGVGAVKESNGLRLQATPTEFPHPVQMS
jgi:hypothetical protein